MVADCEGWIRLEEMGNTFKDLQIATPQLMGTNLKYFLMSKISLCLLDQSPTETVSCGLEYYKFPVNWKENIEIGARFEGFSGGNFKFSSSRARQKQAITNLCRECHSRQNLKFVLRRPEICSKCPRLLSSLNHFFALDRLLSLW
jgi:hypothetical protein